MKKRLLTRSFRALTFTFFGLAATALSPSIVSAQCSYTNNQYPSGNIAAPVTVGQTVQIATCSFGGEYASVTGFMANHLYTIAVGGMPTGYITVFNPSNVAVAWGATPLQFVPPVSGDYKTQWSTSAPPGCGTDATCHATSVQLTAAPPAAPPTPTQDPTPPTCTAGTSLTVAGSPAAGTQWYWQTSATGTSTATPYSGPYTVMNNGTYYIRTYEASTTLWSSASSFVVSNFPTATAPPTPVADVNPSCAPTGTVLTEAAAPAGYVYYWQGTTSGGVSTALNASSPYNVTTSGTYYVAAYETATQCWSNTVGLAVTVDSYIPPAPVAVEDPVNACLNSPSVPVGATPGATTGTSVVTFGTNYVLAPGTATLNGTLTLPAGATITSSVLTFDGITTGPSQYLSDMSFDLTGASTYPNTTFPGQGATDAGPFNYNTTTNPAGGAVSVILENTWFQSATYETITLTVNWTTPTPTINWFDAATGGANIGTGSPLEGVGTSVLPNTATEGSYIFYAAATVGGCTSGTTPITVNITPVLAELAPVDVTCNGGDNGSFTLGTVTCGNPPFQYSINAGPYGAIPTDLTAGTYYVTIQDASMEVSAPITVVIAEPSAPTDLIVNDVNYYSAEIAWTAQGDESEWLIEYGPAGFTPGTGDIDTATSNPWMLTGLNPDTEYEFYVTAICSSLGETAGPVGFETNEGFFTHDNACGPGFIDISATGTPLNLTDDQSMVVTSGFPIEFQGVTDDQIEISNNGWIYFSGVGFDVFSQDLDAEEGNVYYETVTIGGENYFVVQWDNRPHYQGVIGQNVTFQIVISETTGEVYYIYEDVVFGGTQSYADYGGDAYIAAAWPAGNEIVSEYDPAYLQNNTCIHFYNALCPNVQDVTMLVYQDDAILDWEAGLYGETEWTVVWGYAGFDPATEALGTQSGLTTSDVNFGQTLTQLTEYDVYIYSECTADNLTSGGFLVNFTTLPFCSNPFDINGTTLEDTIDLAWDWTEVPGYPVSGFNVMYGMSGFELYSPDATEEQTNSTDLFYLVENSDLIAGGVYEVYVQAECSTGDTSSFSGPFTVVMPLTNDPVCGAEMLEADGTLYTFNNTGAGVEVDESSIAPPADGAQVTTGWTNSTLNGTTWFTFVAPSTGSVRVNSTAINYNGQSAVYSVNDCGDFGTFALEAANDNAIGGTSLAPNYTICGLTPGATYYLMHDGFNSTQGNYSLSITPIVLEAGTAAPVTDICSGSDIDLFGTVNSEDAGGIWTSADAIAAVNASIDGSNFTSAGLAYVVFDFEYRVTDGCAYDSIVTQVHVYGPSNAGQDGVITVCRNEPTDLLSGLNGNVDLGGTWYDPMNNPLPGSNISSSNIPGQYNYDYISGNGVCPDDTANVVVTVQNCNWLDIQEEVFAGVSLYPNPSEGIVFITSDVTEAFDYAITDAKGAKIAEANGAIKAQTNQIDLSNVETGVYFIRLSNSQAEKVFRVVIR